MASTPTAVARAPQAAPRPAAEPVGDAASPAALARLEEAVSELKMHTMLPLLHRGLACIRADQHQEGSELMLKALEIDERCGLAWHILAVCREKVGDFTNSLKCYESALQLSPEDTDIASDLGRLAYRMGMKEEAEQLFAHHLLSCPGDPEAVNNLATVQRDQMRFGDAVETIRPALYAHPDNGMLWNTLGTVMAEQGDMEQAVLFFDEALTLEPDFAKARYNRGNARLALGDADGALADCEGSMPGMKLPSEASMVRLARSTMTLAMGRLGEGWDFYEERFNPDFQDMTHFLVEAPRWEPELDLSGKRILVVAEQGLGDEVLFANTVPDLIEALGPQGQLSIALEHRLIPLFERSFPSAQVGRHDTYKVDHHTVRIVKWVDSTNLDCWTPMGSLVRRFRRSVDAYPNRPSFLKADPARVAHWREVLKGAGEGPKVGVIWKTLLMNSGRYRGFSPFEEWGAVLKTPGVRFVNLQYGDCAAEMAEARERFGVELWQPPGIDLKDDLDEVAALTCALDLNLGPPTATTNIAAACGAPVWLVVPPGSWPLLGTDHYPWYPQARVFIPPGHNRWGDAMRDVAGALAAFAS